MEIVYTNKSEQDVKEIDTYYFKIDPDLSYKILNSLRLKLLLLEKFPEIGSLSMGILLEREDLRSVLVQRYKIVIFYKIIKNKILIVRVLNTRSNIKKTLL